MRLAAALTACLLCSGLGGCDDAPPAPSTRPSAILYIIDTLRADALGLYGNRRIETPHLDRFAAEGVVFENAFANSTWTRASVASLFTGMYPPTHGAQTRDASLLPGVHSIAEILADDGYTTGFVSTNPNVAGFYGFGQGFDDVIELYDRKEKGRTYSSDLITRSDEVTRVASRWVAEARQPFFLVVHTIDPHEPYAPPERFDRYMPGYRGQVGGEAREFGGSPLTRADRQRIRSLYAGEVSANDDSFGALLRELDERGLRENLLVAVTADHGEEFWEYNPNRRGHGHALADAQLRVPLLLRFPASDRVAPGRRVARAVQLVDVAPTLLSLLGVPAPGAMDGADLLEDRGGGESALFASLVLDGADLHAVTVYPHRLVVEPRTGHYELYDLSRRAGGPADLHPIEDAPEVRQRLQGLLDAYVAEAEIASRLRDAEIGEPAPVPERVNEALRALGYVD